MKNESGDVKELLEIMNYNKDVIIITNKMLQEQSNMLQKTLDVITNQNEIISEKKKFKRFKFLVISICVLIFFSAFYLAYFNSNTKMYYRYTDLIERGVVNEKGN